MGGSGECLGQEQGGGADGACGGWEGARESAEGLEIRDRGRAGAGGGGGEVPRAREVRGSPLAHAVRGVQGAPLGRRPLPRQSFYGVRRRDLHQG